MMAKLAESLTFETINITTRKEADSDFFRQPSPGRPNLTADFWASVQRSIEDEHGGQIAECSMMAELRPSSAILAVPFMQR